MPIQQTNSDLLLVRAARGEIVERPPVWAMRQAGRWDPEFRRLRANRSFFAFSEDVDSAVRASLAPLRFGVDAVILFYDITTLPVAMGLPFALRSGAGPMPDRPIRTLADVERLDPTPPPASYHHILELLRRVRSELAGRVPVIVFAGAPFTVATYCIGTGKNMEQTLAFATSQSVVWQALLERLEHATVGFLQSLTAAGADIFQLFDSWAGMLPPELYQRWALRHHQRIFATISEVPSILFVKDCPYLEYMCESGARVISLGVHHDLRYALRRYPHLAFQGNIDAEILRNGTPSQIRKAVWKCLEQSGGQRHIVNLNHGVDKDTPVANFAAYVEAVKQWPHAG